MPLDKRPLETDQNTRSRVSEGSPYVMFKDICVANAQLQQRVRHLATLAGKRPILSFLFWSLCF